MLQKWTGWGSDRVRQQGCTSSAEIWVARFGKPPVIHGRVVDDWGKTLAGRTVSICPPPIDPVKATGKETR